MGATPQPDRGGKSAYELLTQHPLPLQVGQGCRARVVTYAEQILDYVWSVAPGGATNGQIARHLGIRSQQTVYLLTQELVWRGLLHGTKVAGQWVFNAVEEPGSCLGSAQSFPGRRSPAAEFEIRARRVLSERYAVALAPGTIGAVRKRFDFVSTDASVAGDAKYFTTVGGMGLPSAKFSIIAEHVWLLEKTGVHSKFLVFGNDRHVPVRWLERYGSLAKGVDFYFLEDDDRLDLLSGQAF